MELLRNIWAAVMKKEVDALFMTKSSSRVNGAFMFVSLLPGCPFAVTTGASSSAVGGTISAPETLNCVGCPTGERPYRFWTCKKVATATMFPTRARTKAT